MLRKINKVFEARYSPMGDLVTYNALPSAQVPDLDPFLFLNHHGPQVYPPNNRGLPFGPHPHRGMETVTFVIDGDIMHKDSHGFQSVVKSGGIQWMTAGSGLVHAEVSSEEFLRTGGNLEILQLWLNLPAKLKNSKPNYVGKQKEDLINWEDDGIRVEVLAGNWKGTKGSFKTLTDLNLGVFHFEANREVKTEVPEDHNIFCYVVDGNFEVNGVKIRNHHLVHFLDEGTEIEIISTSPGILLFGDGKPFGEPIVARGPFVMNSEEEILESYAEFRAGKYGFLD